MKETILFKIRSIPRLLSFKELTGLPNAKKTQNIKVIDLKSQKNYCTNYRTIIEKFR